MGRAPGRGAALSPGALERINERRSRAQQRSKGTLKRVLLLGVPVLLAVLGFFAYRYYLVRSTIADVRRIVASARNHNAATEEALEEAIAWNMDGYSKGYPAGLLSRLDRSAQIAMALGSVLEKGGRAASALDPTVLPDIDLPDFEAGASVERGVIARDGLTLVSLIRRQCNAIEDRLGVCDAKLGECLLAGDLVMLRGAYRLTDRWEALETELAAAAAK